MQKFLTLYLLLTSTCIYSQSLPTEMYLSPDGKTLYTGGKAPTGLYEKTIIRDIHLDFPQANYWTLLTNNYESETEIPATMTVDNVTYDSVGVRFRGNTSYFMIGNSSKKSFAVSSDFIHADQVFMGYKNLKFNNAHQDASFMREVVYCQMSARHTPIAKANYIHLFLNNQDWGIYPNIQAIDKTYLAGYFMSNDGARFRATTEETGMGGGGPGWGDGKAGMNYLGADTSTYQEHYELKSSDIEDPWQKLIDACQILGTATASNMETVSAKIDIDKALWFLAVENIFSDDDSYIMKGKMDYYVYYEPETDRTTPLEYDGNSTFQTNTATSNNWGPFKNVSNANYPLLNKLLNIPQWRQRYLAHYRTILQETFTTEKANALIDSTNLQIKDLVNADTKKLYSYAQYTSEVSALKTFVANRRNFLLSNSEVAQVAPVIQSAPYYNSAQVEYQRPVADETVYVKATVTATNGISNVNLYYATGIVGNFTATTMFDDGVHEDGLADDGVYGAAIRGYASGTMVRYYIEAIADNAALSASYLPAGAEHDVYIYTVTENQSPNGVVINEILASNNVGATDEAGDHEDWIELYNTNDFEVDLSGFYLSDDVTTPDQWQLPAGTLIPADSYLIIWADDESVEGAFHANFKLSAGGETIRFSDSQLSMVDEVEFGAQTTDLGYARFPNGFGAFRIQAATFNSTNDIQSMTTGVVVNEILASNNSGQVDEAGDFEDWIELYNNNETDVDLSGFYLTDNGESLQKWIIPAGTILPAKGYLIIWADEEQEEGALHTNFKLSAGGEAVILSDPLINILDSVVYGAQTMDMAYARIPNGVGWFVIQAPTFNDNNDNATGSEDIETISSVSVFPNPFTEELHITGNGLKEGTDYSLSDQTGRIIKSGKLTGHSTNVPVSELSSGFYYIRLGRDNLNITKAIKL